MPSWSLVPVLHNPFEGTSFEASPIVPVASFDERTDYLNKRTNAYGAWTKGATIDEIMDTPPFGAPKPFAETKPVLRDYGYGFGFGEGEKIPLPESRNPGINALIEEKSRIGDTQPREQQLMDALGAPPGMRGGTELQKLNNFIAGEPISWKQVDHDPFADWFRQPSVPEIIANGMPTSALGDSPASAAQGMQAPKATMPSGPQTNTVGANLPGV